MKLNTGFLEPDWSQDLGLSTMRMLRWRGSFSIDLVLSDQVVLVAYYPVLEGVLVQCCMVNV